MALTPPKLGDLWKHKSGEYHTVIAVKHTEIITWGNGLPGRQDGTTFLGPLSLFLSEFSFQRNAR